jgi:cytoskeletal protein CcmA (bactofilin family)
MTMRRLVAILVVAAACGTVFSVGILMGRLGTDCREADLPISWLVSAPALAQERMEFKRVPPESISTVIRPRTRVRDRITVSTDLPPEAPTEESGDLVRFGKDIVVREGQTVVGDVVAMGGDVTVNGHVEGEVVAMGGDVFLGPTGRVDGQVVTIGGQLHEEPGSHVGGQRVTAGRLPHGWSPAPLAGVLGFVNSGFKAAWTIAKMLLILLIAWGFTQLAPQRTQAAFDMFKNEPVKCLGFGLLAWALIIPSVVALALVVAILCITIIGIPLAIAVLLGYVLAIVLLVVWGYVVGAAVLGERIARQIGRSLPSLTLMAVWGIVALTAVKVIGYLFGGLPMGGGAGTMVRVLAAVVTCVLMTVGAGSLLVTQLRRDALRQWWPGARAASAPDPAAAPAAPAAPPPPPPGPMPYTEPPAT